MARVNKAKRKATHAALIQSEQISLGKKNVKALVVPPLAENTKMAKSLQPETRREKIARKKLEAKKRKAPASRMDVDRVKKTAIRK